MTKVRITISSTDTTSDDLKLAARVRRDIWAHSPVEIDPDNRVHGTHRDSQRNAYFEFITQYPDEVKRVLDTYGYTNRVTLLMQPAEAGEACANCGNITGPVLPTVCPNCQFRDISPCPHCLREMPRQSYLKEMGNMFHCANPDCRRRVRMRFNDPMFNADGTFRQPLVVVEAATGGEA